ncbi:Signal-peptide peptidase, presenilin aspartyl protease [Candidatus Tiddalikarchaeum anstoanum]|nr:Signal-peptide peptidase, presenilin aspartyl protease [Candidatus Tiddalikarchaeum anstoanum]
MKYELKTALIILSLFFLSQVIGLFVIGQNIKVSGVESLTPSENTIDALYVLPFSIVIITVVFLILYKLKLDKFLIIWYSLAFITCVSVTLASFINEIYALIIAVVLLVIRFDAKDDNIFHNMTELLVYAGLSVLLLPSLGMESMIILLILISAYDVFAVNFSKHMIVLAKTQLSLNIFSGFKVKVNNNIAALGGGDVVLPLILAGIMLRDVSPLSAILVVYGSFLGLLVLILTGDENKVYPAMPYITAGCILGLIINSFL